MHIRPASNTDEENGNHKTVDGNDPDTNHQVGFRSNTTCGSPTTTMLESRVAMKIPTVVTVRTTHLYSKRTRHTKQYFSPRPKNPEYKLRPKDLKSRTVEGTIISEWTHYERKMHLLLHIETVLKPPSNP
jgi:hypothetical protein